MAATPPPGYTPPPTNLPQRGVRATFSQYMDAWITWFSTVILTQLAAMIANAYANAADAFSSATTAQAAADGAIAASNVSAWVSGTTYAVGDVRFSLVNFRSYRRRTAGAGTTDPSLDPTNWADLQAAVPNTLVLESSQSWTPPLGVTRIEVEVGGGGASSGRTTGGAQASPGAPAGGTAIKTLIVNSSTTYTVTVGAGGTAPALGSTNGNNGGTSSFSGPGITTVSATGGNASTLLGGVGSGGDLNITGSVGVINVSNQAVGKPGGSSFRSGSAAAGANGNRYGGGAASSNDGTPALVGGSGYVIIKY